MTSLISAPTRPADTELRHRRPLVVLAALGGVLAAAGPLLVCLALGVTGWFLADAGAHGAPRDGLRVGALGWLMAHGSGVTVNGASVTVMPLGVTFVCAWICWRVGLRVGDSVSGHGPDADRIADGERDWTVPIATLAFALGYAGVTALTSTLATTPETAPSMAPSMAGAISWSLMMTVAVAGPAIAVGSGRMSIWSAAWPASLKATAATAARILALYLVVSCAVFVGALLLHFAAAANVMAQLDTDAGETSFFVLLSATVLPNATLFSGSYLLGPGFAVGVGTLVSPTAVIVGALPLFPLLAALPDAGPTPAWVAYLMGVPVLVAMVGAALAQRRRPTGRWDEGALRGCAGGVLAGVGFALLTSFAGGSAGPGRMRQVAPYTSEVLVHAVTAFGIGGLIGGLLMTWWQRRRRSIQ